jgi:hypothetical protein
MLLYESFAIWNRFIIKMQYFNIITVVHYIMETKKPKRQKYDTNNNNILKN